MIFQYGVRGLVRVGGNALRTRDIHKGLIVGLVRLFGYRTEHLELGSGVEKALVASGNVIVHFNAKDMVLTSLAYGLIRIVVVQAICRNAHRVGPILLGLLTGRVTRHNAYQ